MGHLKHIQGDVNSAIKLFQKAADLGNADAAYNLVVTSKMVDSAQLTETEQFYWLDKARINGHPEAGFAVAEYFLDGIPGFVEPFVNDAVSVLVEIISQSPIISNMFASGVEFYSTGNIESACESFKMCADAGSEICAFNYAYLMKNYFVKNQDRYSDLAVQEYWMYSIEHSQHQISKFEVGLYKKNLTLMFESDLPEAFYNIGDWIENDKLEGIGMLSFETINGVRLDDTLDLALMMYQLCIDKSGADYSSAVPCFIKKISLKVKRLLNKMFGNVSII